MIYLKIPLDGEPSIKSTYYIYLGIDIEENKSIYIEAIEICNIKLDIHDIPEPIEKGIKEIIYQYYLTITKG